MCAALVSDEVGSDIRLWRCVICGVLLDGRYRVPPEYIPYLHYTMVMLNMSSQL